MLPDLCYNTLYNNKRFLFIYGNIKLITDIINRYQ